MNNTLMPQVKFNLSLINLIHISDAKRSKKRTFKLTSIFIGTFSLNSAISATCSAFAVDAALTSCSSSALNRAFEIK